MGQRIKTMAWVPTAAAALLLAALLWLLPASPWSPLAAALVSTAGTLWLTGGLDHFIAFNEDNGRLVCEAGVLLRDIQRLAVPRGWMLPVTPGTQLVTVGGAIANDVHGKNHHVLGSFGDHVLRLTLLRTNGETIECGPHERSDWFAATVGGVGLTGIITHAELQLRRTPGPWLDTETLAYANLDEFFQLADASEAHWEHTVSWIDCMMPCNLASTSSRVHDNAM